MKNKIELNLKDAYHVLDILDAMKIVQEGRVTSLKGEASDYALQQWRLIEELRVRILVKVKKAEGLKV